MLDRFWHGEVQGSATGVISPEGNYKYDFSLKFNNKGRYSIEIVKFNGANTTVMASKSVDVKAGETVNYRWGVEGRELASLLGKKPAAVILRVKKGNLVVFDYLVMFWRGTGRTVIPKAGAPAPGTGKIIGN